MISQKLSGCASILFAHGVRRASFMQHEISKTVVFVFLFAFSTYAISKAFWILGLEGKVQSFGKLCGTVSLLIWGVGSAIGLVILLSLF